MAMTTRGLINHLSALVFLVLIGAQMTMLSYGARCVHDALAETRARLSAVAAPR